MMKPHTQVPFNGKVIEAVWAEMYEGLRAFISRRISNEADVDDLMQEVFLRVHQRLDSLKELTRVTGWIYQIVRHAIVDYYRVQGKRQDRPMGLGAELEKNRPVPLLSIRGASELEGHARQEISACVRPLIAQLSQEYRDALIMVELEGQSQSMAAQKIGLSLSGMKSRVQRARKQLKRLLHSCCLIQLDQRKSVASFSRRTSKCADCT